MKKIKIKGKDYVMAHERVKEFHNLYKNGSIKTELIEMTDRFITKTVVTPDVENPDRFFTGYAYEDISNNGVNSTSALENCETSSCARALGMLNIGIDTSIASYEEVSNAIEQQNNKPKPISEGTNPITGDESDVITFGKHKGKKWSEVEEGYIDWVANNSNVDWQREKAQSVLDELFGDKDEELKKPDNSDAEGFTQEEIDAAEKKNEQVIEEEIPF